MEEKQKELKTELQLPALTHSKTAAIVDKGNLDKILHHKEILKKIVNAIEDLKVDIEKAKLEAGEIVENEQKWGATIEQHTDEADLEISDLTRSLEEAATRVEDYKCEKEKTLLDQQQEEELEFEKLKLEQKAKIQQTEQAATKPASKSNLKMPKLIITKYDGTYEKWLSFWNKFEAEIDSSDLPAVTKFAHLKELLESNVCESIDGLPFTSESYQRAKNILTSNYGKISEIVKAYIDNLNALPVITGSQPRKIHKFCQTLNYHVQSLETLGKLSSFFSCILGMETSSNSWQIVSERLESMVTLRGDTYQQRIILPTLLAAVNRSQKRNNCGGGDQHGSVILEHGPQTLLPYPPQNPVIKEVLATALSSEDKFSVLMQQHSLLKALRVCAWVSRFLTNSRNLKPRGVKGPLTTDEMKYQDTWWTSRAQEEGRSLKNFEADKLQLNLQPDNNGILECRGRIVGAYPIYLPDGNAFTHKLVQRAHLATLHGGVTLTMTKVQETHWIPHLRKLTKKVIKSCWGCKRFRAQAYQSPPLSNLPTTRTQGVTSYETIGVDFAGPIKYQVTKKMQG